VDGTLPAEGDQVTTRLIIDKEKESVTVKRADEAIYRNEEATNLQIAPLVIESIHLAAAIRNQLRKLTERASNALEEDPEQGLNGIWDMLRGSFELQPHWHLGGAFAVSFWPEKASSPEVLVLFGDRRLDRHFSALPLEEEAQGNALVASIEISLLQTGGAWLPFTFRDSLALEWEWWGGGHTEGHVQRAKVFMQNYESVADSPAMLGSLVQFSDIVSTFTAVCNDEISDPEYTDSLARVLLSIFENPDVGSAHVRRLQASLMAAGILTPGRGIVQILKESLESLERDGPSLEPTPYAALETRVMSLLRLSLHFSLSDFMVVQLSAIKAGEKEPSVECNGIMAEFGSVRHLPIGGGETMIDAGDVLVGVIGDGRPRAPVTMCDDGQWAEEEKTEPN